MLQKPPYINTIMIYHAEFLKQSCHRLVGGNPRPPSGGGPRGALVAISRGDGPPIDTMWGGGTLNCL